MALLVCYDGTRPAGWQTQANAESVQSALESAVYSAFGERVRVAGSGRTDSGVHAAGQVCSFRLENGNVAPERVADALNRFLPDDIRVLQSAAAAEGFDACRSAKLKTYRYQVYVSARENPLKERYSARVPLAPDLQTMREAARELVGEHDFKSFCASGSAAKTTVREVISITVEESESYGSKDIRIDVCGKGFLYNMVRIIAGTLLAAGYGKISTEKIRRALQSGERELLGKTMPAKGLTLLRVIYDTPLF